MRPIWYLIICAVVCLQEVRPITPTILQALWNREVAESSEYLKKYPKDLDIDMPETRKSSGTAAGIISSQDQYQLIGSSAKLFTQQDGINFASKVRNGKIASLEEGCGRGKNRLAKLDDGTKFCCRYRDLQWREIRGEFYSYHFNNLLGIFNSPPTVLLKVNYTSPQWKLVIDSLKKALWMDQSTIVITQFVEDLMKEKIPQVLRKNNTPINKEYLNKMTYLEQDRFLQWSDLILFDFIIGHSDRIFNTLLNLQWHPKMMDHEVHNLWKTAKKKQILLLDNESGFWMGYKLGWEEELKFKMQVRFLEKLCIFRNSIVNRIKYLVHDSESAKVHLQRYTSKVDPQSFQMLDSLNLKEEQEFETRLQRVEKQFKKCKII